MSDDLDEGAVVKRCVGGDSEAFGLLVERYQRPIFTAIFHMVGNYEDACELTQQAFMKAFEHIRSFDPSRKFFSWMYRIAMNETINHVRSRRHFETLDREDLPGFPRSQPFEAVETNRAVRQAVLSLTPEHRAVVVLRHLLECSYRETSEVLNLPEKTVKSRLFEARQQLRLTLAPAGETTARRVH
jgi:RNA polymerase sigma-70 factor, ECF subfamily